MALCVWCCRCGALPLGLLQNQTFFPRTVRADGTGRLTVCMSYAILVLAGEGVDAAAILTL
jgi:hypothetical protein